MIKQKFGFTDITETIFGKIKQIYEMEKIIKEILNKTINYNKKNFVLQTQQQTNFANIKQKKT